MILMWEHVALWMAFAVLCLCGVCCGCSLIPQTAVTPGVVPVRQVTLMAEPWWVQNAESYVRSREPVQ
jgi:hypothetical protein